MNYHNNKIFSFTLVALTMIFLTFFFTHDGFFLWAFERHQNTLSWFIRPVLILPFCYFAYKKSLNGILLNILAILTSMFWFPVPDVVDPKVIEFLEMEKAYLQGGFSLEKLLSLFFVVSYFVLLAQAFWKRSYKIGVGVIVLGAVGKILWSILESPEAGESIIPFALSGIIVFLLSFGIFRYYKK